MCEAHEIVFGKHRPVRLGKLTYPTYKRIVLRRALKSHGSSCCFSAWVQRVGILLVVCDSAALIPSITGIQNAQERTIAPQAWTIPSLDLRINLAGNSFDFW